VEWCRSGGAPRAPSPRRGAVSGRAAGTSRTHPTGAGGGGGRGGEGTWARKQSVMAGGGTFPLRPTPNPHHSSPQIQWQEADWKMGERGKNVRGRAGNVRRAKKRGRQGEVENRRVGLGVTSTRRSASWPAAWWAGRLTGFHSVAGFWRLGPTVQQGGGASLTPQRALRTPFQSSF